VNNPTLLNAPKTILSAGECKSWVDHPTFLSWVDHPTFLIARNFESWVNNPTFLNVPETILPAVKFKSWVDHTTFYIVPNFTCFFLVLSLSECKQGALKRLAG